MAITISGQNNNDKILASDGVLDQISGFNVVGVLTASTFETTGEITANHIDVGSSIQLGNAGIITATTLIGNVTGNVNSTSNLLLQISGSEKFRVGNGGQFGIAGANYGTAGQVFTSGGSGSAPTWSTINSDKITEGNTEAEVVDTGSDGRFTVKIDGTERLRINNTGIGTFKGDLTFGENSKAKLFENGNNQGIQCTHSSSSAHLMTHDGNEDIHVDPSGYIRFEVAGSERVRIDSDGRLLVNTTSGSISSAELFEVKSTSSGFSHFRNNHSGYAPIYIDNEYTNTAMAPLITITDGGGNRAGFLLDPNSVFDITGQGAITFSTGGTVGNATERLRITTAGQLVMGATTSKAKFEIKDNGYTSTSALQRISADDDSPYALIIANDTLNTGTVSGLQFFVGNTGTHMIRARGSSTASNNNLQLVAQNEVIFNSGSSETERLRIKSDGTIKIGNTSGFTTTDIPLQVHNPSGTASQMQFTGTGTGATTTSRGFRVGYNGSGGQLWNFENNYIRFATNNAERMRISSEGYVTKANNPSFKAFKSGGQLSTTGGAVIVYDNATNAGGHNTGTHYNTSNGRFTAPIAGKYFISMGHIMAGSYTNNALYIRVNGSQVTSQHFTQSGSWHGTTLTAYVNLNANDYVDTIFTANTTIYGGTWNHFAGHLVQ